MCCRSWTAKCTLSFTAYGAYPSSHSLPISSARQKHVTHRRPRACISSSSDGVATRCIRTSGRSPAAQCTRQRFANTGTFLSWKPRSTSITATPSPPPSFFRSRAASCRPATSHSSRLDPGVRPRSTSRRSSVCSPSAAPATSTLSGCTAPASSAAPSPTRPPSTSTHTWLDGNAAGSPTSGTESLPPRKPSGKM